MKKIANKFDLWPYFVTTQQRNASISLFLLLQNLHFHSLNRIFAYDN